MVHECKVKFLVATFQRGSLHLCSGFHQESGNESSSWQRKLAGLTVDPLLGEPLLSLQPQMNWHLRHEKEPSAPAKIVTAKGMGGVGRFFFFFWTTGGLPGHLAGAAQRVHPGWEGKVEHHSTGRPRLIPRLCEWRSLRHWRELKETEAESHSVINYLCIDQSHGSQLPHS